MSFTCAESKWRMTVNYYKLNQVETPTVIAVPDVVFLLEQIGIAPGIWYANIGLDNAFFFIPTFMYDQKQFTFTCQGQQYNFTVLHWS